MATSERKADDPLGPLGDIYRPDRWLSGSQIRVAGHRQILVWPFVLRLDDGEPTRGGGRNRIRDGVAATIAALEQARGRSGSSEAPVWEEIRDLMDHVRRPHTTIAEAGDAWEAAQDAAQAYGEFVYFYDFLQKTLFRTADGPVSPPFRLWRRTDLATLEVVLEHWSGTRHHEARVERFNLYVFDVGAAVAVIELDFGRTLHRLVEAPDGKQIWQHDQATLADVQLAVDQVRRVYPPYYSLPPTDPSPGRVPLAAGCPIEVTWHRTDGGPLRDTSIDAERTDRARDTGASKPAPPWTPDGLEASLRRLGLPIVPGRPPTGADMRKKRAAPLADHWRQVLRPLAFAGYPPDVDRARGETPPGAVWRHILDERIPLMSFVSLSGAAHHGSGLANAPEGGPREDLRVVRRGDWVRLCSADGPGNDPLPYAPHFLSDFETDHCYDRFFPSDHTDGSTRYMFAGYHFCVVGAGPFFDGLIVHHFRRHYFQMALLLNMELAALLATSSRITETVARLESLESHADLAARSEMRAMFRDELTAIQEDFLTFVHRFRFTDVSNQIQPSELYRMWRRSMRLEDLYADVKDELAAAVGFAMTTEQAETGRDAARLSTVATVGLPFALAFSFLPIFSEVVKNSDPWSPANVEAKTKTATVAAGSQLPPFDWLGSTLWAALPLFLALSVAMLSTAGLLWMFSGDKDRPNPRPSLRVILLELGTLAIVASSLVLYAVVLHRN